MLTFNFNPFPTLSTQRLVLRQVLPSDSGEIFFFRSDEKMMQYIQRKRAVSKQEAEAWIERITQALNDNTGITWGIALKENPGTLIGTIGFWRLDNENHRAEIGYQLHTAQQGRGLMHEAIQAALDYAFEVMHLHSIAGNVDPQNSASIKTLERSGFVREAHFKEDFYFEGIFYDSVIYSLLNHKKA